MHILPIYNFLVACIKIAVGYCAFYCRQTVRLPPVKSSPLVVDTQPRRSGTNIWWTSRLRLPPIVSYSVESSAAASTVTQPLMTSACLLDYANVDLSVTSRLCQRWWLKYAFRIMLTLMTLVCIPDYADFGDFSMYSGLCWLWWL